MPRNIENLKKKKKERTKDPISIKQYLTPFIFQDLIFFQIRR